MSQHSVDDLESEGSDFYRAAIGRIVAENIPFLVGGAYALEAHTGIVRRTKDFDIFVLKDDAPRVLATLARAGYRTEMTFPHWIGKAFCGEDFIDVIFASGNGICPVDAEWFEHAITGRVLGMTLQVNPAEEAIWQKSFILERDRCDVADVAHLIRHCGQRLDWPRLLRRFDGRWRVLLAQLLLYEFIYPGHRQQVPDWVIEQLLGRHSSEPREPCGNRECHGTLLSATQYLRDVDLERYADGRLVPLGNMSSDDIAIWTANFMKPK